MRAYIVALVGIASLFILSGLQNANAVELEGLDGQDPIDVVDSPKAFVGEPKNPGQCRDLCMETTAPLMQPKPRGVVGGNPSRRLTAEIPAPQRPMNYYLEASGVVTLIFYVVVAIWGNRVNGKIAEAFARQHCIGENALFPRQFALCGAGEPNAAGARLPMLKDSSSIFKFYASGRRHCQGCLATLLLRNRPDLMAWPLSIFLPSEDTLEIEVYMNEANMPLTVLAVGTPRQARSLAERADVHAYAKPLKVATSASLPSTDTVPNWPAQKLSVLAEHSSVFYELFTDPRVNALFTSPASADKLRLFRSLLVTSENSAGSHKRLLRFVFALPAADDMAALGPLLALVPLLIDLVGVVKLSPELKKRAVESRAKQEAASADAEENRRRRIEAVQRRKLEKAQEEKERLARLAPEARRKAEEKLAKQAAKKSMKIKMVRM